MPRVARSPPSTRISLTSVAHAGPRPVRNPAPCEFRTSRCRPYRRRSGVETDK
jgi:hypothetical protein